MSDQVFAHATQRSISGITYALERHLMTPGQTLAKLGDTVRPETVVAEGKVSAGFRIFHLPDLLKVSPKDAQRYLHRPVGAKLYRGDVIAEVPKLFGLRKLQFLAPVDGEVKDFNPQNGTLTLQFTPITVRLTAGVAGKVTQIIPNQAVFVESRVNLVFGSFVTGQSREGALHVLDHPDQPIPSSAIGAHLSGHIIAGGSLLTKEVLDLCLAYGVKGVVTGGIAAHDLVEISNTFNAQEDIGLTILVTSGLGNMPMEEQTYQFLKRYHEHQTFLVSKDKMLVVPDLGESPGPAKSLDDLPSGYLPIKTGDSIRILAGQHAGEVATVIDILPAEAPAGSRLKVIHCLLERGSGDKIKLPVTNIEILAP